MGEVAGARQRKLYLTQGQERELVLRHRSGDRRAGEQVINSHYPMILKAVRKFCGGNMAHPMWDDLLQEAQMGLMRALAKFDLEKDFRFATYARWWVDAYLQAYFVKNWSIVSGASASSKNKALFYAAKRVKKLIDSGIEKRPTREIIEELARDAQLNVKLAENLWHRFTQGDVSADSPIKAGSETTFSDNLVDPGPLQDEMYEETSLQEMRRQGLQVAMKGLSDRQRMVIQRRLLVEEPSTLREIGQELGVSHERVRQIQERALELMRPHLEHLRDAVPA